MTTSFTPALTPAELEHILWDRAFCKYMVNRQPHDTFRQSKEYRDFRAALRKYLNNTPD